VSGSIAQLSAQEQANTRRYIEAQLDAYEQAAGWFFWTWKTQLGSPEWEMRDLINNKVFPQPLTERWYGNQCGF
jgi:glucan 1,3-beta-glucosidase